jgi:hypothetical protein
LLEAVSSLLSVAVKICYASSMVIVVSKEYLTRKFLPAVGIDGWRRLLARVSAGKEVIDVKYFKITKTWAVKAESEAEAIKLIAAEPVKYLDSETVTRTEYKRPQPKTGWGTAVKEQLLGSNSKRQK